MIGFVLLAVFISGVLIYSWVKLVNKIMNPLIEKLECKKQDLPITEPNPYIQAHLLRQLNDRNYEEYLEWLDKTGGDLPIHKMLSREEWEFKKKIEA